MFSRSAARHVAHARTRSRTTLVAATALTFLGSSALGLTGSWLTGAANAADASHGDVTVHVTGDRNPTTLLANPVNGVTIQASTTEDFAVIAGSCVTGASGAPAGACTITQLPAAAGGTLYHVRESAATTPFDPVQQLTMTLPQGGGGTLTTVDVVYDVTVMPNVTVDTGSTNSTNSRGIPNAIAPFVAERVNPAMPATCGLRVALLFDLSNSVSGNVSVLQTAGNSLVSALEGTPSEVGIYDLANSAATDLVPTSVATSAGATSVHNVINGLAGVVQGTNMDAGLREVAAANADVAIVLTDGNPTHYLRPNGTTGSNGFDTDVPSVNASVISANMLKAAGTRVIALGIANGLSPMSPQNLKLISGPTLGSDYYTTDASALHDDLAAAMAKACASTITVHKNLDGKAAAGWTFTPTSPVAGVTFTPASAVTNGSGNATFAVNGLPATGAAVTLTETAKSGVSFQSAQCSATGTTSGNGAASFAVPMGATVSCTFANATDEVPPPPPTGGLAIDKTGPATADYGDTIGYTIKVSALVANQTGVVVTDPIPAGTTYVAGSAACVDAGPCTTGYNTTTKTVSWQVGTIAAGNSRTVTLKVVITKPAAQTDGSIPQSIVTNTAYAVSNETPSVNDKAATVITGVLGEKFGPPAPPKGPGTLPLTGAPVEGVAAAGIAMLIAGGLLLAGTLRRRGVSTR